MKPAFIAIEDMPRAKPTAPAQPKNPGALYQFSWANTAKRATMKGRTCLVICRGTMNSAMVEFTDTGQREVVSRNALRRLRP